MATEKSVKTALKELILKLYDVCAIKFGSFTLKSGIVSPVYFDLRVIVSYPQLMSQVSDELWKVADGCTVDCVCGVPYTALPLATCISTKENIPMLIRRKEAKDYGTKKIVEGHFKQNDICLIVEDVVTSGSSVWETVQVLEHEKLKVHDAVVLLDREQGGSARLATHNVKLHSVCTISQVLQILEEEGKLDHSTVEAVQKFIADNNTFDANATLTQKRKAEEYNEQEKAKRPKVVLNYEERADQCSHPLSKRLFSIMHTKKTNLCVAVDVTSSQKLLELTDQLGPYICVLKTHIDIVEDFSSSLPQDLMNLAHKHDFLIFEDRKFADIGQTVKSQYAGGMYHIADWAHITNAHAISGPGIISALKQVGSSKERACLLIAQMSSKGNLLNQEYTNACVSLAEENRDFVIGFISTSQISTDPNFIHMTPGVSLSCHGDSLGQQYSSVQQVIEQRRSDVLIVGRDITQADDPVQAARNYQTAGYAAYRAVCDTSSS